MSARKKSILFTGVVFACVFILMAGGSQATTISGEIWDGSHVAGASAVADNPSLGTAGLGTPTATFTVTALNFYASSGGATYAQWLSGGVGNPNGLAWVSDPSNIENNTIYTSSGDKGTAFQFDWDQYVTTGMSEAVTHDDGFYLTVGSVNYNYSPETVEITSTFSLTNTPSGIYHFTMIYGETNGFPAVLEAAVPETPAVPEPATMLLLGSGLIGLVGYGRRKFLKK